MTELETKIYKRIIKKMDLDEAELEGFDENSPLFIASDETPAEGVVTMGLDSVDWLELVVLIEKEWNIEVKGDAIDNFNSIKSIADYIISQQKA